VTVRCHFPWCPGQSEKIHRCRRDFNSHIRTYPRFSDQIKKNASNTTLHQWHFLIGDFLIYKNHQISQFTYFGIYADDFGVREHGTLYFTRPKLRRCISASRPWCTVNERRDFAKLWLARSILSACRREPSLHWLKRNSHIPIFHWKSKNAKNSVTMWKIGAKVTVYGDKKSTLY